MENKQSQFKTFWWVVATTAGWMIGLALPYYALTHDWLVLSSRPDFREIELAVILANPAIGFAIGILQWLVLRNHFSGARWWIPVTFAGGLVGFALTALMVNVPTRADLTSAGFQLISPAIFGLLIGLSIGTMQWLVLKRNSSQADPLKAANWSSIGNGIGIGFALTAAITFCAGFLLMVMAFITGDLGPSPRTHNDVLDILTWVYILDSLGLGLANGIATGRIVKRWLG